MNYVNALIKHTQKKPWLADILQSFDSKPYINTENIHKSRLAVAKTNTALFVQ